MTPRVSYVPRWAWLPFIVMGLLLVLPIAGMISRAPLTELPQLLSTREAQDALRLSFITCAISTVIVVLVGVPSAVVLARSQGRWVDAVRTIITVPIVMPPVVAGLALLVTFGRAGVIGQHLQVLGIEIGFTTIAVMLAQIFVSLPYLVLSAEGALRTAASGHEGVAAGLGASPSRVFWKVTVPLTLPALASGTALAFARALGEFGATLTFAGSLQGTTRTLPLQIYLVRETDTDTALALAVILILVAVVVIAVTSALNSWKVND